MSPVSPAQMVPLSNYPQVDFDLSFDVPAGVVAAELVQATTGASDVIEWAEVFDEYRPEGSDARAIAIRYRLRAADRTLEGDEIAADRTRMIEAAAVLGATLRGSSTGEE